MYLYKILSVENWEISQGQGCLVLDPMDEAFIHFATEEQLQKVTEKFWKNIQKYLILVIDISRVKGDLVLEKNPGGETEYYHLYGGSIPRSAVVSSELVEESV